MALSILSSSRRLTRLISTPFKSPISYGGRMMSTTTTFVSGGPSPCLMLPPTLQGFSDGPPCLMLPPTLQGFSGGPLPCLMLPPTLQGFSGDMIYNLYNLAQNNVINFNNNKIPEEGTEIVGSSHGWLALFDVYNSKLTLTNPVTRRRVKLPPTKHVSKVIISCDAEQDECQAMMIDSCCRLYFCRPGRSPIEWTPIGDIVRHGDWRHYQDVVYSSRHKLFFCVTMIESGDDLEGWDVASDPPRLRWENRGALLGHENYRGRAGAGELLCKMSMYLVFVEQADQLFLVTRHLVRQMAPDGTDTNKTVSFDVYKIDWELDGEGGRLSHLNGGSLDGLAMFVGLNHSFAVSATEANGLKPNSIYFTDDPDRWVHKKYGGHDIGIFDYENKTISPCYYPCDLQSFRRIMPGPVWFTPNHN